MQLIGITGAKGSGKSSVANILTNSRGFVRLRYADALKRMLRTMGLTYEHIDGDLKNEPCDLLGGKTPRWAMQSLGTEWGRKLITNDLWVNIVRQEIIDTCKQKPEVKIVIDDVRYPNEVASIAELGGSLWRVRRPDVEPRVTPLGLWFARRGWHPRIHSSEAYWRDFVANAVIPNDGNLHELKAQVLRVLPRIPVL